MDDVFKFEESQPARDEEDLQREKEYSSIVSSEQINNHCKRINKEDHHINNDIDYYYYYCFVDRNNSHFLVDDTVDCLVDIHHR